MKIRCELEDGSRYDRYMVGGRLEDPAQTIDCEDEVKDIKNTNLVEVHPVEDTCVVWYDVANNRHVARIFKKGGIAVERRFLID